MDSSWEGRGDDREPKRKLTVYDRFLRERQQKHQQYVDQGGVCYYAAITATKLSSIGEDFPITRVTCGLRPKQ